MQHSYTYNLRCQKPANISSCSVNNDLFVCWSTFQVPVVVDSVWAYDEEAMGVFPGENVKLKLKNVEEDVSISSFNSMCS